MTMKKAMAVAGRSMAQGSAAPAILLRDDLHVLELGAGVMLDVFINIEGRLTTFVSVDGQLIAELRIAGHA